MHLGLMLSLGSSIVKNGAPAPAITSITPDFSPEGGGASFTIVGTGFVTGATVTINGNSVSSPSVDDPNTITGTLPAGTAGVGDVVVTNPDTQVATLASGFEYKWTPATLALSGWWKASYGGSPWAGNASAGASTGRDLSSGTAPNVGTAQNGKTPADFPGGALDGHILQSSGVYTSDFYSGGTGFTAILFKADTADTAQTNAYDDEAVFSDENGHIAFPHTSSGIRATVFDGADWVITPSITCATGAYHWFFAWWVGDTLYVQLDGGTSQSVPFNTGRHAVSFGTDKKIQLGQNYDQSKHFDGKILEVFTSASDLSASIDDIVTYGNDSDVGYALSL